MAGTLVHVNVAKGPTQVGVAARRRRAVRPGAEQLQAQGFAVARKDVESSQPKGTVISQSPAGGVAAPAGSTVTLSVSLGPPATPVPDVTSLDETAATATLQAAGFTAKVVDGADHRPRTGRDRPEPEPRRRHRGEGRRHRHDHRRRRSRHGRPASTSARASSRAAAAPSRRDPRRRPLERARGLAGLGALGAGRARPGALRRAGCRDRPRRALGARPRRRGGDRRRDAARARRRRRPPRSARWTSCCRSSTGRSARTAPSRGCSSWRASPTSARGRRLGALHGQGPVQGGDARPRDPGPAQHHLREGDAVANPFDFPVFVKPARLGSSVGISKAHDEAELDGGRRARAPARRQGARRGVRGGAGGRGRRARQPRADRVASPARSSRTPSGTTTPRSTTRAAAR